ncbi:signal peptidase I [Patescibacteria group bacterium]
MEKSSTNSDKKSPKAKPGYKSQARLTKPEEIAPPFKTSVRDFVIEVVKVVVIALAIIIPVRYFLVQPFYVKGASMEPNFQDHEYLIIDEISYRFREPNRGEVIVVRNPQQRKEFFIKRIVGLPGETVEITNDRIKISSDLYPTGIIIDESSYLPENIITKGNLVTVLGDTEYFIMGDNRNASLDSRIFGPVNDRDIIGRAWLRAWPITEWRSFSSPVYNYP